MSGPHYNLLPTSSSRPQGVDIVHRLTQAAFAPYAALERPSGAIAETVDDVAADLEAGGGLVAYGPAWSEPRGCLRWRVEGDHLWVKRVAVDPAFQGQGIGDFLMDACRGLALGHDRREIRLGVRHSLERNRRWYERRGFRPVVEHEDWTEYAAPIEPFTYGERATLWKYEHPDHLQARLDLDVVQETADGIWTRMPAFTPFSDGTRVAWIAPAEAVFYFPKDEWWVAAFSTGHMPLKVDICTPPVRRTDGDLEFHDLCLDVIVSHGRAARIVDEDEFDAAGYDDELCASARRAADDVLRRVLAGEEPFATEGFRRLGVSG